MPQALSLPSPAQLATANRALESEIGERRRAEATARTLNAELEARVAARTAELETANAQLRAALREKEALLQEVHHRVKNNLQIVAGLLSIQARTVAPELAPYFADSLQRIRAMGRIHQQLYTSADASRFDLGEFLEALAADLGEAYGASSAGIACRIEAEPVQVDFDVATPLVLIVNEVLSNAFKHAFPEGSGGEIVITVRRSGGAVVLAIRDSGPGMPAAAATARRPDSMGLRLIDLLARQIGAATRFEAADGTVFTLSIAEPAAGGDVDDAGAEEPARRRPGGGRSGA
jgi:two-component sensor histidine kinase